MIGDRKLEIKQWYFSKDVREVLELYGISEEDAENKYRLAKRLAEINNQLYEDI